MTIAGSQFDELQELLDQFALDELTPDRAARLEELAASDPAACERYIRWAFVRAGLRSHAADAAELPTPDARPPAGSFVLFGGGLRAATANLLQGWPAAYLIATVVLGVGLAITAVTHVSPPDQVVRRSFPGHSSLAVHPAVVGRITGTADCRFAADSKTKAPRQKSVVSLGDKIALISGLLEITYDTGARVILQGPVEYEVESAAGGFLSLGKLTARVETAKPQDQRPKTLISHPSSLIPHPLFSVRTPTATVTDLGTEFGVEVARDGRLEVHVLKGSVQAQFHDANGRNVQTVQLVGGEARRYLPATGRAVQAAKQPWGDVAVIPLDRAGFERMHIVKPDERYQRWLAHSRQLRNDPSLVAYYPFESMGRDSWLLTNAAATGEALAGRIEGPLWSAGRFPGKVALRFRGPGTSDRVILPEQERFKFTGPFSVAVWFRPERFQSRYYGLVAKGDSSWRLQQYKTTDRLCFDTSRQAAEGAYVVDATVGRTEIADGRWHLATSVYAPAGNAADKALYVDGRLEARNSVPLPLHQNDEPVWLGANGAVPQCEFRGVIDEVAIFSRALSADEVARMFDKGNPELPMKDGNDKRR
jgi:hypothetical protein